MLLNDSDIDGDHGLDESTDYTYVRSTLDNLTITDTGRMLYWFVDVQELLTTFDQLVKTVVGGGAVITKNVIDNLTILDSAFDWLVRNRFNGEQLLIADQLIGTSLRGRVTTDNVLVIDGFVSGIMRGRTSLDTISISDSFFKNVFKVASDNLSVTDGYVFTRLLVRALGDAITIIDGMVSSITGAGAVIVRTATDFLTIGDGFTTYMLRRRSLDESLTIQDVRVSGVVRNRRFDDFISQLVDFSNKELWKLRGDTLIVSEQTLKTFLRTVSATDSLTLQDGVVTAFLKTRALTDLLQITDETIKQLFSALTFDVRIRVGLEDRTRVGVAGDGMPVTGFDQPNIVLGGYS